MSSKQFFKEREEYGMLLNNFSKHEEKANACAKFQGKHVQTYGYGDLTFMDLPIHYKNLYELSIAKMTCYDSL